MIERQNFNTEASGMFDKSVQSKKGSRREARGMFYESPDIRFKAINNW